MKKLISITILVLLTSACSSVKPLCDDQGNCGGYYSKAKVDAYDKRTGGTD
ncbi:hypothetical protein VroAM7_13140 [Vibrio rotiferianus]|uniref:Lipoprotein n=1 Tax=Vibrio rotiferianus TaxID=190895 RepID=A0A510I5B6_9VIBR|nr:hypothetical protein [Vibrio rotiferianus]BBL88661.1 hypothetical protein VroAM7_13140 [Vibrio rotiferianus]